MLYCPICNSDTENLVSRRNNLGDKYEYFICKRCRFLFEKDLALDSESLEKRVGKIYQNDYFQNIDSGWKTRGDRFLKIIKKIIKIYKFLKFGKGPLILDYGGGNGYISAELAKNFNVAYYDKYETPKIEGNYKILKKPEKADIIYAVELAEHITNIKEWDFLANLSPDVFVFTTGLSDNIEHDKLADWPYLDPSAGHMAIYSYKSLYILARKYGFCYIFFPNISSHIFLKNRHLSSLNIVWLEYFIYSIFRKIKKLL